MPAYACPNCRNKTRFHIIEQHPVSVKLDPQSGEVLSYVNNTDPFSLPYRGEARRVQCSVCGMNEGESLYIKTAQRM